ncbi:hypothetical protein M514_06773 [Trichuris suis]|uniref:Uncharacterized protein n=1 Tax=Trichuris suis TaxID=68888 RepID=A0A085NKH5_9BILA|nr:hypothetical protein M514_06773 [Trichuris suis]
MKWLVVFIVVGISDYESFANRSPSGGGMIRLAVGRWQQSTILGQPLSSVAPITVGTGGPPIENEKKSTDMGQRLAVAANKI